MSYYSIDEILDKMKRYCAYQERSHYQVEQKLFEYNLIKEAKDYIIIQLIKNNFLNEERFARSYVRSKFYYNKWGKRKIIQGLKKHKIHTHLIDKALDEITNTAYIKLIKHLIEKKNKNLKAKNSFQKKQKIINFLLQKGYSYEEILPYLPN